MPDFTVDIGGLEALQKNLNRTKENIDGATKKLDVLGPDSIGSDELDEACADFREDWEEGLEEIKEAVEQIAEGLDKAMQSYHEVEEGIRENLRKMAEQTADLKANNV
ncbi:hypothetical protein [Amycolatopsis suaedae]|uniref:Uncharacterized protein n=1 Tax=Amycolatopsis suaedae TaxID=2510978 RepID=A0A4Q7J7A0_9PSEU|nr:hypothetical protein [Amycolatopsis suaedae]RZQ62746.1 hypothetical protein EWH70_17495 [Amycolatopsis suaedae]